MRIIDLIKDVMNADFPNIPNIGFIKLLGIKFACMTPDRFEQDYNLIGETKSIRYIVDNEQIYSIGFGGNKQKGWIRFKYPDSFIELELQDFVEQEDSYLILKYGKVLLEEI